MVTKQLEKDLEYTYERLSDEEISRLENSSILITGCAGFLGFYFVHFLSVSGETSFKENNMFG